MQLFYSSEPVGSSCVLDEQESRHAVRVLRLTTGDHIYLTDGSGTLFKAIIKDPSLRGCVVDICEATPGSDLRPYSLEIAISPLKNPDRFEWFVEKAVEIGVDLITPVICDRTEKQGIKSERIEKLITTAMKQSGKTKRTVFGEPVKLRDFLISRPAGTRLIAHCNPGTKHTIGEIYRRGESCSILIGPEGDFSVGETEAAIAAGYKPISLGNSRLRTETAGIAACHSIYFLNQI
jgi:16S rRNA (uracil1498-N3)-methyltransferase